ncbi:MAG TPA: DUF1080 domain-containing protein [Ohtaekwangia sp.]|nr:DUF1080 domain-containing protein [Ohtaekwangia sp.]
MRNCIFCFMAVMTLFTSCKRTKPEGKSIVLFNGTDLQGWDTYLGPSFDTVQHKRDTIPLGLNHDTLNVFSVVQLDGGPVLRVSGERFGGISTHQDFANYHLTLEFRWGKKKWPPKDSSKRDSGILYHAVGDHGADFGFWMRSQEFQVQEGDCGDYWGVAGGIFDIPASKKDGISISTIRRGNCSRFARVARPEDIVSKIRMLNIPQGSGIRLISIAMVIQLYML